jgi:hypothetical protein
VRTLARIILLVVCLGYGIVRNHLSTPEVVVVTLLSVCYFVSGVIDEVTRGTSSGADFRQKPTAWSFIQLVCNLTFILWIQHSLERILKVLREQKQFAKLSMYRALAWSLAAFVIFFTILTVVAVCRYCFWFAVTWITPWTVVFDALVVVILRSATCAATISDLDNVVCGWYSRLGVFEWDVEWEWMQLVAWPVLNFIVSAAMCFIWRPSQNSSQYAFSMQLPMTDDQAGVEMTSTTRHSSSSEDDPEMESDDDEIESEVPPAQSAAVTKKHVDEDDDDIEEV